MSESRLPVGALVGHYEVIRQLGRTRDRITYLARDTRLGRRVQLERFEREPEELSAGADDTRRGRAHASARCTHKHVVTVHNIGVVDGRWTIVKEYLPGLSLREWLHRRAASTHEATAPLAGTVPNAITAALAVELVLPVVRGLVHIHERGLVHRHVRPETIILADIGTIKLVDLCTADADHDVEHDADGDAVEDDCGERVVSRDLMWRAPEQQTGGWLDARTDIWGVGAVLLALLDGHAIEPSSGRCADPDADDGARAHASPPAPRTFATPSDVWSAVLSDRRPELAGSVIVEIVDRCLAPRPADRFASASALLARLEFVLNGQEHGAPLVHDNPFAGLASFQESDAARFFGRDTDVVSVKLRLQANVLVALTGPSGAGKSSFVRAGLIPALKRMDARWHALIVRPGRRPLNALVSMLLDSPAVPADWNRTQSLTDWRAEPGRLGEHLRAYCRDRDRRLLVFVDQFEELHTLCDDSDERQAFIACIHGLADDPSSPLRVVIALRSDHLDKLADDRSFLSALTAGLVVLPALSEDGLRQALSRPLAREGYQFESENTLEQMLGALATTRVPLPLLQFTAAALWDARDEQRKLLTDASYRRVGGVAGALARHADAVIAGFSTRERQVARSICVRLVTRERTRAIVPVAAFHDRQMARDSAHRIERDVLVSVLEHLADARLLLLETDTVADDATVELVHESLIEQWPTLGRWLDETNKDTQFIARVHAAATQWRAHNDSEDLLWRGAAARDAERWFADRRAERALERDASLEDNSDLGDGELDGTDIDFLRAVIALAARARRRRRRLTMGGLASLLALALVVSYLAIRSAREADRAERQAQLADRDAARVRARRTTIELGAVRARNATRMAAARERQADPTTVLALLRELEPAYLPSGWSSLTRRALHSGVARIRLDHPEVVRWAVFSPDGTRIATASWDRVARIWNADGAGEPIVLRGHKEILASVAFSPDGTRIVTASVDGTARIWNADGSGVVAIIRDPEHVIWSAEYSPDGTRIAITAGNHASVWTADGTRRLQVFEGHEKRVWSAEYNRDGTHIVTSSEDRTARVFSVDDATEPVVLRGHTDILYTAAFSLDGTRVVTSSADRTARIWNADGSGEPVVLSGHTDRVYSAGFSPDGTQVVTGSSDQTARVWSADDSGQFTSFRGHAHRVYWAAFSPDGTRILTASSDKTLRVWDVADSDRTLALRGHRDHVYSAAFSHAGTRVISSSLDRTARVWNADGTGVPLALSGHRERVYAAAFSPDDRRVVTASGDGTARIWHLQRERVMTVLAGHDDRVYTAAFSADGMRVVTASGDGTARIWRADNTREPIVLRGHTGAVYTAAFNVDSTRVITASSDQTARIWRADGTGTPIVLRGHEDRVYSAAFSHAGTRVVTASSDQTARIWRADGTGPPIVLRGHEGTVGVRGGRSFSPDDTRVVTHSHDGTVRIWEVDGTADPLVVRVSQGVVNSAAFSPDGHQLVVASDDSVRVIRDLAPIDSLDDKRMWTRTSYCPNIEERRKLLGVTRERARANRTACLARVRAAVTSFGNVD